MTWSALTVPLRALVPDVVAHSGTRWFKAHGMWAGAVLAGIAILLAIAGLLSHVRVELEWVVHTEAVLNTSARLLSTLQDAETGQRGYLLTNETAFLEPYEHARVHIREEHTELMRLTADNPGQHARVAALGVPIQAEFDIIGKTVAVQRAGNIMAAQRLVEQGQGKTLMDNIRAELAIFEAVERALLAERSRDSDRSFQVALAVTGAIMLLTLAIVLRLTRAVRASTLLLRTVSEHTPEAIFIKDIDTRLLFANPPAVRILQSASASSSTDLMGRTNSEILRDAEQARAMTKSDQTVMKSGETELIEEVLEGDTGPRHFLSTKAPLRNARGQIVGLIGVSHDITERKLATRALEESESQFHGFANNIPTLCWMADETGSIFWYNSRWYDYTGTTPEQMYGWGWQSVHDPDMLPMVMNRWTRSIATGALFEMVFPLRRADGVFRSFLTRVAPVRDDAGRLIRWFGINTDVTDQRSAVDMAQMSERQKDEFLAMLAHELRNPLAPILNASLLLARTLPADPAVQASLAIIDRQTRVLSRLVDDLLDVSNIAQGRVVLRSEPLKIARIIEQVVELVNTDLREKKQRLRVIQTNEALYIQGDQIRMVQSLGNLLNNASKYTKPGGELRVEVFTAGEWVVIEITDNGNGIASDLLPRVFDLFVRGERTPDHSSASMGIGLAVVKRLIELHKGTVTAESAGVDQGSTFSIRLPRIAPPEALAP